MKAGANFFKPQKVTRGAKELILFSRHLCFFAAIRF
jgi:hypothetical protein